MFVCFQIPAIACGLASTCTLTSLQAWTKAAWGVLASKTGAVPRFQSRLQFSKCRAQRNWGITFLEPALSYLSMSHSCNLEILPQLNCKLTICVGYVSWMPSNGLAQRLPNLAASYCLSGGQLLRTDNGFSV